MSSFKPFADETASIAWEVILNFIFCAQPHGTHWCIENWNWSFTLLIGSDLKPRSWGGRLCTPHLISVPISQLQTLTRLSSGLCIDDDQMKSPRIAAAPGAATAAISPCCLLWYSWLCSLWSSLWMANAQDKRSSCPDLEKGNHFQKLFGETLSLYVTWDQITESLMLIIKLIDSDQKGTEVS